MPDTSILFISPRQQEVYQQLSRLQTRVYTEFVLPMGILSFLSFLLRSLAWYVNIYITWGAKLHGDKLYGFTSVSMTPVPPVMNIVQTFCIKTLLFEILVWFHRVELCPRSVWDLQFV